MLDVKFVVVGCRRKSDKVSCFAGDYIHEWAVTVTGELGTGRLVYTVSLFFVNFMGALTFVVLFLIPLFIKLIVACRLCVIFVREDNDSIA